MRKTLGAASILGLSVLLMGATNGEWLDRVSTKDHARTNPLSAHSEQGKAAAAGGHVYYNDCAKCHGKDGLGKHGRPPVISNRVARASDGDLFWLMTNGVPWRGMPGWQMLPADERWQLVAYLRALNSGARGGERDVNTAVAAPESQTR